MYVHLYIYTEYSDLFRFGVGILPGLGRISFGIQAQLKCNIRYIHTYFWVGLDFEIANSYYFFFAFALEVSIVSLVACNRPPPSLSLGTVLVY